MIKRIIWYFRIRLPAHIRVWRNANKELNRRVKVEQYLLRASVGKEPLPDKDKCAELAKLLGVPNDGN